MIGFRKTLSPNKLSRLTFKLLNRQMNTTDTRSDESDVMSELANPEGELLAGSVLREQKAKHPGVDWNAAIWIGIIHLVP